MFTLNSFKPKPKYNPIDVVIIGQNEGEHIQPMLESLKHYMPDSNRIWILDRCTDDSEKQLRKAKETYYNTHGHLKGRQTSYSRNLGLSKTNLEHDVLFLDGDRYPVLGVMFNLKYTPTDVTLLLLDIDDRVCIRFDKSYGTVHNGFYSCGVFFKRESLNKILKFQKGELFNTKIQKDWGIEDMYLGDVCYHLDLSCGIYYSVRLRGRFDTTVLKDLKVLKKRFKLRQKLNVKW